MWSRSAWTRPRIALLVGAIVLVLLAGGQVVLPRIAEGRVRDELGDDRAKVDVEAFPAWKLVAGRADRIRISTPTVRDNGPVPLDDLLKRAHDVGEIDARIGVVPVDQLRLDDLHVRIRDARVQAAAALSVRALSALVPGGGALTPLPPGDGGRPRFSARVGALGISTDVVVAVSAVDGRVVVRPEQGLASLVSITVFQDPAVRVDAVTGDVQGDRLRIAFSGRLA